MSRRPRTPAVTWGPKVFDGPDDRWGADNRMRPKRPAFTTGRVTLPCPECGLTLALGIQLKWTPGGLGIFEAWTAERAHRCG